MKDGPAPAGQRATSYVMTYAPLDGREDGRLPMSAARFQIRSTKVRMAEALRASADPAKRAQAEDAATVAAYPVEVDYHFINLSPPAASMLVKPPGDVTTARNFSRPHAHGMVPPRKRPSVQLNGYVPRLWPAPAAKARAAPPRTMSLLPERPAKRAHASADGDLSAPPKRPRLLVSAPPQYSLAASPGAPSPGLLPLEYSRHAARISNSTASPRSAHDIWNALASPDATASMHCLLYTSPSPRDS